MTKAKPTTNQPMFSTRPGCSRNLLSRKASEKSASATDQGEPLEASFPALAGPPSAAAESSAKGVAPGASGVGAVDAEAPQEPLETGEAAAPAKGQATGATWSEEDEAALQAMLARRKAVGYQRRGRDGGRQLLKPGAIRPNPDTIVATIVGIVGERGTLTRAELVSAMASAKFPHPKARPSDKAWCQGYVAGALRSGFLADAAEAAPAAGAA